MLGGIGGNCSEELISMISNDQGDDVTFLEDVKVYTVQRPYYGDTAYMYNRSLSI